MKLDFNLISDSEFLATSDLLKLGVTRRYQETSESSRGESIIFSPQGCLPGAPSYIKTWFCQSFYRRTIYIITVFDKNIISLSTHYILNCCKSVRDQPRLFIILNQSCNL